MDSHRGAARARRSLRWRKQSPWCRLGSSVGFRQPEWRRGQLGSSPPRLDQQHHRRYRHRRCLQLREHLLLLLGRGWYQSARLILHLSQPIVLAENATFSSSGNLCLPLSLPAGYVSGSRATLYVEASGDHETVSSCAGMSSLPAMIKCRANPLHYRGRSHPDFELGERNCDGARPGCR